MGFQQVRTAEEHVWTMRNPGTYPFKRRTGEDIFEAREAMPPCCIIWPWTNGITFVLEETEATTSMCDWDLGSTTV